MARSRGFLQSLDPRLKIVAIIALVLDVAFAHKILAITSIFILAIALAISSRISLRLLATSVWLSAFFFTGLVAFPAIFITPGYPAWRMPGSGLVATQQGIRSAMYLMARVETTATLVTLLMLSTLWVHLLKALRIFRVPQVFIVLLGMAHRYIFLFLETARDMLLSRQSRSIGKLEASEQRRMAAGSIGVLLLKSLDLSSEVHFAMLSRGFRGEVYTLNDLTMKQRDWTVATLFLLVVSGSFYLGR